MKLEREVKLAAWGGFVMPPLDGVVEGVTSRGVAVRNLDATYYDTPDLRLARSGVSLRHRAGDALPWTVKLPEGDGGAEMLRKEISFGGTAAETPAPAADLVRAYARSASLGPVARLKTVRTGIELVVDGTAVAEVVDDEVSVYHGRRLASRFREVEVEVEEGAPRSLLAAVVRVLRSAGAGEPDATPKVVRALGPLAQGPPDLVPVVVSARSDVASVVRAAVTSAAQRVIAHDPGVRMGDHPEDVHQARVGTRRLRSDLRTFRPLLDRQWVDALRAEAGWFAGLLGDVRDAEVLAERLERQARALSAADAAGLGAVTEGLSADRDAARERLLEEMNSKRYLAFLDSLVSAAADPGFALTPGAGPLGRRPAAEALPRLVRGPWRRLRRAVRALDNEPADEELHAVRILAKHCRYAAEAAAPVVGKRASAFAAGMARLQTVLGDHQDACFAETWLRGHAAQATPAQAILIGQLISVQRTEAAECRARWRSVWRAASEPGLRSWLA